jgi:hypothetical protein
MRRSKDPLKPLTGLAVAPRPTPRWATMESTGAVRRNVSEVSRVVNMKILVSEVYRYDATTRCSTSCVRVFPMEPLRSRPKYVIGPDGSPLTIADLPAAGTTRWVIRRKAQVIVAVRGGLLSLDEACSRYLLTVDEYLSWQHLVDRHGLAGLRSTRTQEYRRQ